MLYNYVINKVIQNSYLTNKKEEQISMKKQEDDYVEFKECTFKPNTSQNNFRKSYQKYYTIIN